MANVIKPLFEGLASGDSKGESIGRGGEGGSEIIQILNFTDIPSKGFVPLSELVTLQYKTLIKQRCNFSGKCSLEEMDNLGHNFSQKLMVSYNSGSNFAPEMICPCKSSSVLIF